jgi:hypothetical protein
MATTLSEEANFTGNYTTTYQKGISQAITLLPFRRRSNYTNILNCSFIILFYG